MYLALLSFCLTSGYLLWAMYLVQDMYVTSSTSFGAYRSKGYTRVRVNRITVVFILNAIGHALYMLFI